MILHQAAKDSACDPRELCNIVPLNELHISENLMYNKHNGALVGFANLGEIHCHLHAAHRVLHV